MDENKKALLIGLDTGEYDTELSMKELWALCEGAGCTPVAELTQKRDKPDTATYLGKGKLQEALPILDSMGIEMAIVDGELTAAQQKGMEDLLDIPVVDRTTVILDIFARNAVTKEGAIQVELAQLRYRLPRLIGLGKSLSRLGGGIGTRGPGETQLETDRRHILRRIGSLKAQLRTIEEHRARTAQRRAKNGVPVIALAGYTNAGKSTLLNRLTGAGVLAEDRLFATLDPTARALTLPDGTRAVLIDTVGFIQRIPHHLIEAFQSTLRNVTDADVILNVCDATSPYTDVQNKVTLDMLQSLGCEGTPVITVLNKWDLTGEPLPALYRDTVAVSSVTGEGIDRLLQEVVEALDNKTYELTLLFPYSAGDKLARLRERTKITSESYEPEGVRVTALVPTQLLEQYREYIQEKSL